MPTLEELKQVAVLDGEQYLKTGKKMAQTLETLKSGTLAFENSIVKFNLKQKEQNRQTTLPTAIMKALV